MRERFARHEAFIVPFGGTFVALLLWSQWGQDQPVTLEDLAIWVTVGMVTFQVFFRSLMESCGFLDKLDLRKRAEEQKITERQELIKAIQYAQRDIDEKILVGLAKIEEHQTKLEQMVRVDNADIRERLEVLEARASGEDN